MTRAKRESMVNALTVFMSTALIAIVANSINGYGFHLNYSISRYVGLEAWSSLMFGISNVIVAVLMARYLWSLGRTWKMWKIYYVVVVVMIVMLLGLSICPIGRFDNIYQGEPGPVSIVHEYCSRIMFSMMIVTAFFWVISGRVGRKTWWAAVLYVMMGMVYALAFVAERAWLRSGMLIFESSFLIGFMVLCLFARGKSAEALTVMEVRAQDRKVLEEVRSEI